VKGAWALVAAVGAAAVAELFAALRPPLAPVSAEDVAQAAAHVRAAKAPSEPVVHSALFSPEALTGFGDLPAGLHLPPPRLRRSPIWIVDRAGWPMHVPDATKAEVARFGEVVVWRAEPAGAVEGGGPLFDLLRDLEPGMMRVEKPPGTVVSVCEDVRSDGGFSCPGQAEWIYAAPHEQVIGGAPKTCVWAHPITDATLVFELPPPPDPGSGELELTVGAGLADAAVQMTDGRPVQTIIKAPGILTRTLTVPNREGWFEETLKVRPGAPIELRITTAFDGMRHHCINATIRVIEREEAPR
jgi:hypothetical protein